MAQTQFRKTILNRAVRPYSLGVSLSVMVMGVAIVTDRAIGKFINSWPGDVLAALFFITAAALWYGWWAKSDNWMRHGLLWSTGVWSSASFIMIVDGDSWVAAALGLCWVVASGGSWLLEMDYMRSVE